jgi:hypothetical protein
MTDRTQFEHMLEALINEDQQTAKDIFHNIVVAKSREIYEELLAEDFGKEEPADDSEEADDFSDKDSTDDMMSDVDADSEDDSADDAETDDMDGEGDVEDRVQDLEDALEDLKAEFEQLMAGEEGEEMPADDMGMDDTGMDDMGMDSDEPEMESGDMFGADEMPADDMGGDQLTVTHKFAEDDERLIREYIEKVNGGFGANIGGDNGVNTKSIVAGKNDMGGTTANIAQGHREVSADIGAKSTVQGNGVMKPNVVPNPDAQGNINVPGGKAGKTSFKTQVKGGGIDRQAGFNKPGQNAGGETGANSRDGEKNTRSTLNARK